MMYMEIKIAMKKFCESLKERTVEVLKKIN